MFFKSNVKVKNKENIVFEHKNKKEKNIALN